MSVTDLRVWYVHSPQGTQGPYTAGEILQHRKHGHIDNQTFLWKEGFAEWREFSQIGELKTHSPAPTLEPCPACGNMNRMGSSQCSSCSIKFEEWKRAEQNPEEAPRDPYDHGKGHGASGRRSTPAASSTKTPIQRAASERTVDRPLLISVLCGFSIIGMLVGLRYGGIDYFASLDQKQRAIFMVSTGLHAVALIGVWQMRRWAFWLLIILMGSDLASIFIEWDTLVAANWKEASKEIPWRERENAKRTFMQFMDVFKNIAIGIQIGALLILLKYQSDAD